MKCKKISTIMSVYIGFPLLLIMIITFAGVVWLQNRQVLAHMEDEAQILVRQLLITRQWVIDHNGLWVRDDKGRYFKQQGDMYLKIPPNVLAELSTYSQSQGNFSFRTTSLHPKNPENAPNSFEREALLQFAQGKKQVSGVVEEGGKKLFRHIVPLYTTQACLQCHTGQGYKTGDVLGGLSIILPYDEAYSNMLKTRFFFISGEILIFGLILGFLVFFFRRRVLKPLSQLKEAATKLGYGDLAVRANICSGDEFQDVGETFNEMAGRLKQYYENLVKLTTDNKVLHQKNLELNQIASTDGLTGLFNHRFFHDALEEEVEQSRFRGSQFAVVMMDIDNFKQVNDSFGHVTGDAILAEVAKIIKSNLRKGDLAARYGGEEFALILPGASMEDAAAVAERIRSEIQKDQISHGDKYLLVTISAGIATFPEDALTKNRLLEKADHRLYLAKRKGKNQVCTANP